LTGIRLQFESFNTETGSDYVEIFYVKGKIAQRLDKLTGSYDQGSFPKYTISDGSLELKFHSDNSVGRPGFLAKFERFNISDEDCVCPGFLHEAYNSETYLTSPNYPQPYCHDLECFYLIKAAPPNSIEVKFEKDQFELEGRYDSLTIYEGNSTNKNTKLTELHGTLNETKKFVSRSSAMMLVFRSDGDTAHKGFRAAIKAVKGPCHCEENKVLNSPGFLTSPNFGKGYCANMNCSWKIDLPRQNSEEVLQLKFEQFNMRSSDFLSLDSPSSVYKNPLFKFKPMSTSETSVKPVFTVESSSANLRMFTSAFPGFSEAASLGFNISYKLIKRDNGCKCPESYPVNRTEESSSIRMKACGPLDCFWVLTRPRNKSLLTVRMDDINIRSNYDYVKIYRGTFTRLGLADQTKSYTGKNTGRGSDNIISFGRMGPNTPVLVHFHTQGKHKDGDRSGFTLNWRWDGQVCECGELRLRASTTKQTLTSPGYPTPYCDNMNCKWRITAPPNMRVVVNVTNLTTEAGSHDNLGIYDGIETQSETRLALLYNTLDKYSGNTVFRGNTTSMTVWFTTDGSLVMKGWSLLFWAENYTAPKVDGPPDGTFQVHTQYAPIPCSQCPASKCQSPEPKPEAEERPSSGTAAKQTEERVVKVTAVKVSKSYDYAFAAGFGAGMLVTIVLAIAVGFILKSGRCQKLSSPTIVYKRQNDTGIDNCVYLDS
jgi:cubilin